MESPESRGVADGNCVIPFTGGNVQRIYGVRGGQIPTIFGEDQLLNAVQMHRVNEQTFIHVTQTQTIPFLGGDGLGVREGFAVNGETNTRVIENQRVLGVIFRVWLLSAGSMMKGAMRPFVTCSAAL